MRLVARRRVARRVACYTRYVLLLTTCYLLLTTYRRVTRRVAGPLVARRVGRAPFAADGLLKVRLRVRLRLRLGGRAGVRAWGKGRVRMARIASAALAAERRAWRRAVTCISFSRACGTKALRHWKKSCGLVRSRLVSESASD